MGWSEGAAQMADVRARCVELLSEVPGLTLQAETPVLRRSSRSRWRVTPRSRSPRSSRQSGVLARMLPGLDWVRVSLGYWVSDSDLERLAAALRSA